MLDLPPQSAVSAFQDEDIYESLPGDEVGVSFYRSCGVLSLVHLLHHTGHCIMVISKHAWLPNKQVNVFIAYVST